eukprot:Awhi_evm2s13225
MQSKKNCQRRGEEYCTNWVGACEVHSKCKEIKGGVYGYMYEICLPGENYNNDDNDDDDDDNGFEDTNINNVVTNYFNDDTYNNNSNNNNSNYDNKKYTIGELCSNYDTSECEKGTYCLKLLPGLEKHCVYSDINYYTELASYSNNTKDNNEFKIEGYRSYGFQMFSGDTYMDITESPFFNNDHTSTTLTEFVIACQKECNHDKNCSGFVIYKEQTYMCGLMRKDKEMDIYFRINNNEEGYNCEGVYVRPSCKQVFMRDAVDCDGSQVLSYYDNSAGGHSIGYESYGCRFPMKEGK